MSVTTQVITAFAFGVVFLVLLLVVALEYPDPPPTLYVFFKTVLALAGAGIAAMLTGFLTVDLNPTADVAIRAGGALAVFVEIYFFSPAKKVAKALRAGNGP